MDLLRRVEQQGMLTTEMNHLIIKTAAGSHSKEQQIALNIQYLKCCIALARQNNSVRYFVNMIISPYYKPGNYYRHNRMHANAPVEFYDREVFKQVLDCWNILKKTSLSADDLFFIYINTILKHCISFSSLVYNSHRENNGTIYIDSLLSKYTDYYFGGKITYVDTRKHTVTITPTEFSIRNQIQNDRYIYPLKPEDDTYFRVGTECYFKLKCYKVREYTFILSELKLNKALRERAPEIMFMNAVLNASYNLDLNVAKIKDINANGLKLNNTETASLMEGILNCIYFRTNSSSEMTKFMTIMQKNNPWKFTLSQLPDISAFPHNESNGNKARKILEKICSDFTVENIARIYFNSPIKNFCSLEELLEIYCNSEHTSDELFEQVRKYPLVVTSNGKANYLLAQIEKYPAPGSYVIWDYANGDFGFVSSESLTVPDDYNEEQLRQILESVYQEGQLANDNRI